MANSAITEGVRALNENLIGGAYPALALNRIDETERAKTAVVVYGVLENYYRIKYILESLYTRPPKAEVKTLLYVGVYAIEYMKMPGYAAVNECVELTKKTVGIGDSGFVNAILKRVTRREYTLPSAGDKALEVEFNLPIWMIKTVKKQYPKAYKKILSKERALHIRLRTGVSEDVLEGVKIIKKTSVGYFVETGDKLSRLFDEGKITYQGKNSIYAALALGDVSGKKVLDVCAAPGGKSVLLAERSADVTSEELHAHRAELIKEYAGRMGVSLTVNQGDATKRNRDYEGKFDAVLCDVPCSGLGVLAKNKDAFLRKSPKDIIALKAVQIAILDNASAYVKKGGRLVYSTCTVLREENGEVVSGFMKKHKEFALTPIENVPYGESGEVQMIKTDKFSDGFYIAAMVRK